MTGPEQHANTVRLAEFEAKANFAETGGTLVMYSDLRWLVALAERADTLERENERLRRDPKQHPFSTGIDLLRRAEAAEADRDRLRDQLAETERTWKNQQQITRDEMKRSDEYQEAYRRAEVDCDRLARRVAELEAALRLVPLSEWQELAEDDIMDLIDQEVMLAFLMAAREGLAGDGGGA